MYKTAMPMPQIYGQARPYYKKTDTFISSIREKEHGIKRKAQPHTALQAKCALASLKHTLFLRAGGCHLRFERDMTTTTSQSITSCYAVSTLCGVEPPGVIDSVDAPVHGSHGTENYRQKMYFSSRRTLGPPVWS